MYVLGFAGGWDPVYGSIDRTTDVRFHLHQNELHDSSAVLLKDGRVVAAIEEERVTRIKHTNTRAANAIRFCLDQEGVGLDEVDFIAYPCSEDVATRALWRHALKHPDIRAHWSFRAFLVEMFRRDLQAALDPARLRFVEHHVAHALSAYCASGFDDSLVVTLDGQGEGLSGTVFDARGGRLERLANLGVAHSLGLLYENVIAFLGYLEHDEYKVMGLAPYGDPARYRHLLRALYTLNEDGTFEVHANRIGALAEVGIPRRKGEPFTQVHEDLAAALQEALEHIVLHHLKHYRGVTGQRNLCLAGGVAHNCSMNGRIVREGLFEGLFVQPAAHDAGCALGAAYAVHRDQAPGRTIEPMTHVYWGTDLPGADALERLLRSWDRLVELRKLDEPARHGAELLAAGKVIGWVQGRSEFGPRALGNRSILADPRPAENKTRINAMVKKREAYRPFAPSVLEEHVHEYFDVPAGSRFPYMIVITDVRADQRRHLGAISHVNGSARVHTVDRASNPRYWHLIDQFRELTGVPIVLNTSFNNNAEPIVDSAEDAMVAFLTTGLDAMIVGDYLVTRRALDRAAILDLVPSLPAHVQLLETTGFVPGAGVRRRHLLRRANTIDADVAISPLLFAALADDDDALTVAKRLGGAAAPSEVLVEELWALWERRLLVLRPPVAAAVRVPAARREADAELIL